MKAIILVGGEGTRLRPLTYTVPKAMLPIAEVPMIERIVARLNRFGVNEAVLSLGYRPDAFRAAFPTGECRGVKLTYAVEPEPLDTAGGIAFAARYAGIEDRVIVLNGDVLTDLDLNQLIDRHRATGAEGTIALTPVEDPSVFGVVPTDDLGRVTAFIEKPPPGSAPTNLINAGTYILEPQVIKRIEHGRRVSIEREIFPAMVADGTLFAMASPVYWLDAGQPRKYLQANLDILAGNRPEIDMNGYKSNNGVWFGDQAVIEGKVDVPALVGEGAHIGAGAELANCIIGSGCNIGEGVTITNSVCLPNVNVEPGSVIDGSIVGEDVSIGKNVQLTELCVIGGNAIVPHETHLAGASFR